MDTKVPLKKRSCCCLHHVNEKCHFTDCQLKLYLFWNKMSEQLVLLVVMVPGGLTLPTKVHNNFKNFLKCRVRQDLFLVDTIGFEF